MTHRRKSGELPAGESQPGFAPVNLVVIPVYAAPVAALGYVAPVVGTPIMREGFVTDTGLAPVDVRRQF